MLDGQGISLGSAEIVVAGGMEHMSQVPNYAHTRFFPRVGHAQLRNGVLQDGLADPHEDLHMGDCVGPCATAEEMSCPMKDACKTNMQPRAMRARRSWVDAIKPVASLTNKLFPFMSRPEEPPGVAVATAFVVARDGE